MKAALKVFLHRVPLNCPDSAGDATMLMDGLIYSSWVIRGRCRVQCLIRWPSWRDAYLVARSAEGGLPSPNGDQLVRRGRRGHL